MKNKQIDIPFPSYHPKDELEPDPAFIVSEVDLIYKSKCNISDRPQIKQPEDAINVLRANWDENKIELVEEFKILMLNRANRVLAIYNMSKGGITGTVADPRLAFAAALKCNATSIILSHNHPSGNLQPSRADEDLTNKFKHAGKFLDIEVKDHVIITKGSAISLANEGLL